VSVVYGSAAVAGSISIRQVCTSRRGGSLSTTSPSTIRSGIGKPFCAPNSRISSVADEE
jgi:hypothetical protein